jgi:hypothetical protein
MDTIGIKKGEVKKIEPRGLKKRGIEKLIKESKKLFLTKLIN